MQSRRVDEPARWQYGIFSHSSDSRAAILVSTREIIHDVVETNCIASHRCRRLDHNHARAVDDQGEPTPKTCINGVSSSDDIQDRSATFGKCEKLYKDGTTNYEIALKGAAGKAVVLTPDGRWVSPKK